MAMRRLSSRLAAAAAAALFPALAAASMFPETPFTVESAGTTAASFLKFPVGARLEAMGGVSAAAAAGPEAIFYNPAGIVAGQHALPAPGVPGGGVPPPRAAGSGLPSQLLLGYSRLVSGANAGSAAFVRSLGKRGSVGGGIVYFSHGTQTNYDALGDRAGSFSPSDIAFSLTCARRFWDILAVGAGLKVIRSTLETESAAAVAVDLGAQAVNVLRLADAPLDLGLSLSNFGSPMKLGGAEQPLPLHLRGGVLWHLNPVVSASIDGNLPIDDDPYVSLGVEARMKTGSLIASLRSGFNQKYSRGLEGFAGATAGAGLDLGRFGVDYAWVPFGDLGQIHRATLALRF